MTDFAHNTMAVWLVCPREGVEPPFNMYVFRSWAAAQVWVEDNEWDDVKCDPDGLCDCQWEDHADCNGYIKWTHPHTDYVIHRLFMLK